MSYSVETDMLKLMVTFCKFANIVCNKPQMITGIVI